MERAALEASAAAGAAEAREWRASVAEQAEAVVALGKVGGRGSNWRSIAVSLSAAVFSIHFFFLFLVFGEEGVVVPVLSLSLAMKVSRCTTDLFSPVCFLI